jgi:hypothetical protein
MDYLVRFVAGGVIVSIFAVLTLRVPKASPVCLGPPPPVALATLTLALWKEGSAYVATEGRSMVLGSLALTSYSIIVCQLIVRMRASALIASTCAMIVWLGAALKQTHGYEYVVRFALGGLATVFAGVIAELFGPETVGLFLAFPAISVPVEKHERDQKAKKGLQGGKSEAGVRQRLMPPALVAGSLALAVFAITVWTMAPYGAASSLGLASAAWVLVALGFFFLRRKIRRG